MSFDWMDENPPPHHRMRVPRVIWVIPILFLIAVIAAAAVMINHEMRNSKLQAQWLTWYGEHISFKPEAGRNTAMRFPSSGPYNQRLGYSYLPYFIKSMEGSGYTVEEQMRATPTYTYFVDHGLYPIYRAKTVAGLKLYDRTGDILYTASYPTRTFPDFASIPKLLVDSLLYIENRELLKDGPVTRNPAIEWDRFFYAVFGHVAQKFAPGLNAGGGSTLATQIEKFRYSPNGQTQGGMDKLRQMASASLRVYLDGPDTRKAREKIALDYLNSTPLSARPGFGEVNSIGDGLWVWFGIELNDAITALNLPETDPDSLRAKAQVYRAALSLILAQRRPSYYLSSDRAALDTLTDATLDRMVTARVISPELARATRNARLKFLSSAPIPQQPPFIEQKAVNALRTNLMSLLGLRRLYEVDRLDVTAQSTLDQKAQKQLVDFLRKMGDPEFVQSIGLYGFRLLKPENDPKKIKWSVVLYERTDVGNKLRLQADNIDEPFDMNEGMKLDLGSTAKLRTLVTYLEIIGELYRRYAGLAADDLRDMRDDAPDNLTQWATGWLMDNPNASLEDTLRAALERTYSGNPGETFFTGGGAHHFGNFEAKEDYQIYNLHGAFKESVNLVFVRVMRDIVNYTIAQGARTKEELLSSTDEPARKDYLERFADQEGSQYLSKYIAAYNGLTPDAAMQKLLDHAHKGATARTVIFRSLRPNANFADYARFMSTQAFRDTLTSNRLQQLYRAYAVDKFSLADRGYIAGINPLELWLVSYLQANPNASRRAILQVSQPVRIQSYAWLFRDKLKGAQDTRIRIMLEEDAFNHIHKRWKRLGYPFDRLVPSLATSIGSSADRPGALAELVGIILNDGVKMPAVRFESLLFGENTPYQTLMKHDATQREPVLDPAITKVLREVMAEVVEDGTAKRVRGVYKDATGKPLAVGGKTGTGDQRYDEFGAGGRLINSRVVNRTGTFAFFIGDHFFGTITAHVAGEEAADYKFTSALSAQMLKSLEPIFTPLINGPTQPAP